MSEGDLNSFEIVLGERYFVTDPADGRTIEVSVFSRAENVPDRYVCIKPDGNEALLPPEAFLRRAGQG